MNYDVIVIGLGGMGSATVYQLSQRGYDVLGLEAYSRSHDFGSSHGRSRIIREVHAETAEYIPLVKRSYHLWRNLEEESGQELLTTTGGLTVGPRQGFKVKELILGAQSHGLDFEILSADEVSNRFPGIRLTKDLLSIFDPKAGILQPEDCVSALLDLATSFGANLHHNEPARCWSVDSNGARVETPRGVYRSDRLIITAGPWAGDMINDRRVPLSVERVVNVHFEPLKPELYHPKRCPVYTITLPETHYYGFPALPGQGVKIGSPSGIPCTPHDIKRKVDPLEIETYRKALQKYLPWAAGAAKWSLTCMYTNTPDGDFVIDKHPEHDEVIYACGFSGHGFKFASAIGEILADLAIEGKTPHSIDSFSTSRFHSRQEDHYHIVGRSEGDTA